MHMERAVVTFKTRSAKKPTPSKRTVVGLEGVVRIIRDAAFAKRFEQACDAHSQVPAKHSGRLTWIQRQLETKFKEKVSVETVRKWFAGEAKPRPEKMEKLAQLLEVDMVWLSLGVDDGLQPRERRARNAMADGAVNVVAGLIQMDGGYPAFPEPTDKKAVEKHVDLHSIIKGAKYDFHVSVGETNGKKVRFVVPSLLDNVIVLGIVKTGFAFEILELTGEIIGQGDRRGGSIEIVVDQDKLPKIADFRSRL